MEEEGMEITIPGEVDQGVGKVVEITVEIVVGTVFIISYSAYCYLINVVVLLNRIFMTIRAKIFFS